MFDMTEEASTALANTYCGPAEILEDVTETGAARVRLVQSLDAPEGWARIALPGDYALKPGDTVLVTGDAPDNLYVIGILSARSAAPDAAPRLRSRTGAYAELAAAPDNETLRVHSPTGQLLFEYDPARNQARVSIPDGDLQIATPNGGMEFAAGQDIRLHGRLIHLSGRWGVRLAVASTVGKVLSALTLQKRKARLESSRLDVATERADVQISETQFRGDRVFAHVGWLKTVADRSETVARIVIERADNAYRTVKELAQLTAGRARAFVDSIYHFKAGKAYLKSDEDFKIQGDKIHLG